MRGINKVFILGRLGKDVETRHTETGTAVANMSVATSSEWKNPEGKIEKKTEWHRIILFAKQAEIAAQYLKKGSLVHIEGKLRTSSWEKDGQKHYATEIVCHEFQMLDPKSKDAENDNSQETIQDSNFNDDIPF